MNIVVMDDRRETYEEIRGMIDQLYSGQNYLWVDNAFALATYLYDEAKGKVDLLIVNITEHRDDNISVAAAIQDYFPHVQIVFYSENNDCAQEIFDAVPSYFLRYPFMINRVSEAVHRVVSNYYSKQEQQITFYIKGQMFKVLVHSIIYIESVGRKLCIYAQDGYREVNMTFEKIKEQLPQHFVQCHRSYIVNMDKVVNVRGEELELADKHLVPIARTRIKDVRDYFQKHMGR